VDQAYRIFTDGSPIGNPGPGGWGAVLIRGKHRWEMSGAHPWTTISEMELVAAVQALRPLPARARIELHSDSEYLIYGMRAYALRWQRHGWRNRRGTQLQHREWWSWWSELLELNTSVSIRWKWIKGHSGHRDQSRADELAYGAARSVWLQQKVAA
jgi:ribonuclease HI